MLMLRLNIFTLTQNIQSQNIQILTNKMCVQILSNFLLYSDLKLSVGDKVELLRWVDDNWLYGKLVNDENKCGMFPANHVKVCFYNYFK